MQSLQLHFVTGFEATHEATRGLPGTEVYPVQFIYGCALTKNIYFEPASEDCGTL